jgi:hypothetical protein
MLRLPVLVAVACLFLVPSGHAGEVYPRGNDFIAADFAFGALGGAAAMAPDGTFVVAWDEFFSGKNARGFDVDGNGGPAWSFDGLSSPEPHSLDVAALGTGEFVVAWESYDAGFEPALLARRFELGGTPLGPKSRSPAVTDRYPASRSSMPGRRFQVTCSSGRTMPAVRPPETTATSCSAPFLAGR